MYLYILIKKYYIIIILAVLIGVLGPCEYSLAAETLPIKKVLILYSFNQDYPIQHLFTQGILTRMRQQAQFKVRYSYEHLDLPTYAIDKSYQENLAQFLKQKYSHNAPDVIIVQTRPATAFMLKYGERIFGNTPVIIASIDKIGFKPENFPSNYTAIFGAFDVIKAVQTILNNQPSVKKIYIILGSSQVERRIQLKFSEQLAPLSKRVEFIFLSNLTFIQMQEKIKKIEGKAAILYTYTYNDIAGSILVPAQVLPTICAEASVPVYGMLDTYFGTGCLGGYMSSWEVLGGRVAEVAKEILQGKRITEIPVETFPAGIYKFDWRELKRWGIDEQRLPAGSKIEFRQPTLWEAYRWPIIGAIILVQLQAVLVSFLLVNRIGRRRAEDEVCHLNHQLKNNITELQAINATLKEEIMERHKAQAALQHLDRLNLVGEMAAGIGHEVRNPMTAVRGYLQLFQNRPKFAEYRDQFTTMIEELDRANWIITEFLSLAKDKTVELKQGNINTVLDALFPLLQADAFRRGHGIKLETSAVPDIEFDAKELRQLILNLVRNGLEAMEDAGVVSIKTYLDDDRVVLAVQDTGKGIPEEVLKKLGSPFVTTKENGTGLGLPVCYRIAQRHNARIDVTTSAEGTTFFVKFIVSDGGGTYE